jgi:hypothetical protein
VRYRGIRSGSLALAAVALLVMTARSEAQFLDPVSRAGMGALQVEWSEAEILTVTPKWLVLQNPKGQQFPVFLADLPLFLIRWPTSPDRLAPDSWMEVTGGIGNSNQILTDHGDIYQGAAKNLLPVRGPTRVLFNSMGMILTPTDISLMNALGDDFRRRPEDIRPVGMYVVGPIVSRNPLIVDTPGNTQVAVLGAQGAPSMTLITQGSSSLVRPGDLVRYLTAGVGPRSLNLSQLWVYKTIPLDQYAP